MGKIKLPGEINTPGTLDLAAACRVAEIHRNIRARAVKLDQLAAKIGPLKEIKILEEHAEVNGRKVLLLSTEGYADGIMIYEDDIESGAITIEQGYQSLAEMVTSAGQSTN